MFNSPNALTGGTVQNTAVGDITWDTGGDLVAAHRSAEATRVAIGQMLTVGQVTAHGYRFVGTVQNALMGDLGWAHLTKAEKMGLIGQLDEITGRAAYGRLMERLAFAEAMWQFNRNFALARQPLEVA